MDHRPSVEDARAALATVDLGRRRVIDEIALPAWYWTGLAVGWVALGVLADADRPVASAVATLAFGTAHAAVAPRILDGRHRSRQLQVRADAVTRRLPALIVGSLVLLAGLTVAGALALHADGARHPVTTTSVGVALVILLGGPQLLAAVRRQAVRGLATT